MLIAYLLRVKIYKLKLGLTLDTGHVRGLKDRRKHIYIENFQYK
jgi:hypothetical protein